MIDAENLPFGKNRANRVVDERGRNAVLADRLLDDDARGRGDERMRGESLGDRPEMIRICREVERARARGIIIELIAEEIPPRLRVNVETDIMDQFEEALNRFVARGGGAELLQRMGDRDPIGGVIQGPPRHANDPGRLRELRIEKTVKQRGKELAVREIAGATEDHQIEGSYLNDTRNHRFP